MRGELLDEGVSMGPETDEYGEADWAEVESLETVLADYSIGEREIPIFTSYSKGRGRKRANPTEVVLVLTREKLTRFQGHIRAERHYVGHKDGDDRLSALIHERLGEIANNFSDEDCLEWVKRAQETRERLRLLRG